MLNVLPHLQWFQDGADFYNFLSKWVFFFSSWNRKWLSFLIIFAFLTVFEYNIFKRMQYAIKAHKRIQYFNPSLYLKETFLTDLEKIQRTFSWIQKTYLLCSILRLSLSFHFANLLNMFLIRSSIAHQHYYNINYLYIGCPKSPGRCGSVETLKLCFK